MFNVACATYATYTPPSSPPPSPPSSPPHSQLGIVPVAALLKAPEGFSKGGTMAQPLKRRRVAQLSGLKWAFDSAVEAVLQRLEEQGALLGAALSRRTLARAVEDGVQAPTLYGPTLHTIPLDMDDNTTFNWHVINPFAMLCWLANLSGLSVVS